MKKLIKNSLLFCWPIGLLLLLLPVDERAKYEGLKEDCAGHGKWVYHRIYENEKKVDIAFLGSSHTINGINDQLIEQRLDHTKWKVTNFGYCRLGRNLNYSLLKAILEKKQPQQLIVEVREMEDRYSHPIFPYLSPTKDVVLAQPFFNRDLLSDLWTHFSYKIELTQDAFFQQKTRADNTVNDFGFGASESAAPMEDLEKAKQKRSIPKPELSDLEQAFHLKLPKTYLEKIHQICVENQIKLDFLYLPAYGTYLTKPQEYDWYLQYGNVFLPPREILDEPANWHDVEHFNQRGAKALSLWMAEVLKTKN